MAPPSAPPPYEHGEVFGPLVDWIGFALRAPSRNRKLALGVFLGVLVLAGTASRILPQKYEVRASLLAQKSSLMGVLSNPEVNRELDVPTRAAREIIVRHDNLVNLVKTTKLVERYRVTRSPASQFRDWLASLGGKPRTDEQLTEDLAQALEKRLWVAVATEGTVTIGFDWSDPQIAFDVVQTAVQSFLEARNAADIGAIGEAITILQVHDARLQKEIAASLTQFDDRAKLLRGRAYVPPRRSVSPSASSAPRDEESVRLEGLLTARRRALSDLEGFRERRLSELQVQLEQQLGVFAEGHPTVASTRQAIEALQQPSPQVAELKEEIRKLEALLSQRIGPGNVPRAPVNTGAVQEELAATQARISEIDDPRLDYERGQIEALLRRRASLVQRIDAARIELDTAQAAFQERYSMISPPQMPKGPLKPLRLILWVLGVVGGAMAAVAVTAGRDLWRGRIAERWQIERNLGLVVLAETRER